MREIKRVEQLIAEINKVHQRYSDDYFETGKTPKINLKRTLEKVPQSHIYQYRLILHESINDYLFEADIDFPFYYRVKTSESIAHKISRFEERPEKYPVNKWLNDIFGCRMIIDTADFDLVEEFIDQWEKEYGLKNWYKREAAEYRGIHIYFKNESNFYFPWELQLWDEKDAKRNIQSHRKYKRTFVEGIEE